MQHVEQPPAEDVPIHFDHLEVALRHAPWNEDEHGTKPDVSDFMLMHIAKNDSGTAVGFKHHDTRNYVFVQYLRTGAPKLYVPRTEEPFMRGEF